MINTLQYYKEKYPGMFDECFDFSIGDGWRTLLIDPMLELIAAELKNKQEYAARAKELLGTRDCWDEATLAKADSEYWQALADRPKIHQIKEKFGTMRLYAEVGPRYKMLLTYIEWMSAKVCEDCGSTTEVGIDPARSWRRTLCKPCNMVRHLVAPDSE